MGITVVLETEDGKQVESVEDPTNVLHRVLPEVGDPNYQCLSRIDWYGDTTFNYLQAPQLLAEWRGLEIEKSDAETKRVVISIRGLAERLQGERHVYLKFYGD